MSACPTTTPHVSACPTTTPHVSAYPTQRHTCQSVEKQRHIYVHMLASNATPVLEWSVTSQAKTTALPTANSTQQPSVRKFSSGCNDIGSPTQTTTGWLLHFTSCTCTTEWLAYHVTYQGCTTEWLAYHVTYQGCTTCTQTRREN